MLRESISLAVGPDSRPASVIAIRMISFGRPRRSAPARKPHMIKNTLPERIFLVAVAQIPLHSPIGRFKPIYYSRQKFGPLPPLDQASATQLRKEPFPLIFCIGRHFLYIVGGDDGEGKWGAQ